MRANSLDILAVGLVANVGVMISSSTISIITINTTMMFLPAGNSRGPAGTQGLGRRTTARPPRRNGPRHLAEQRRRNEASCSDAANA
eukprot:5166391-Pyramimonas_sp.AAC.1